MKVSKGMGFFGVGLIGVVLAGCGTHNTTVSAHRTQKAAAAPSVTRSLLAMHVPSLHETLGQELSQIAATDEQMARDAGDSTQNAHWMDGIVHGQGLAIWVAPDQSTLMAWTKQKGQWAPYDALAQEADKGQMADVLVNLGENAIAINNAGNQNPTFNGTPLYLMSLAGARTSTILSRGTTSELTGIGSSGDVTDTTGTAGDSTGGSAGGAADASSGE